MAYRLGRLSKHYDNSAVLVYFNARYVEASGHGAPNCFGNIALFECLG